MFCGGVIVNSMLGIIIFAVVLVIIVCNLDSSRTPSQIGEEGENRVSKILRGLPQDYYEIGDVIIPTQNSTTQIDHVVVSRYGIFVIETKNYSGWIFGSDNSKKWKQTFKSQSHYFYNPIKQNWAHIYALSELLNLYKKSFKPVVVFSDDATLNIKSTTPVINMSELERHILSFTCEIFTLDQVEEIRNTIISKNLLGTDAGGKHVQTVRDKIAKERGTIKQGKCPRCSGNLVLRNGKYGQFYGCSNYPRCRFTQDI